MAETLGKLLRRKRESLGLTLEKVEGFTHIRAKYLQAIESDDISGIPSVAQARGFIRNYASFLGFRPEEIADKVGSAKPRPAKSPPKTAPPPEPPPAQKPEEAASSTQPRRPITAPVVSRSAEYAKPRPGTAAYPRRNWLRFDWILGGAVTLAVLGFLGWGGYYAVLSMAGAASPAPGEPSLTLTAEATGTESPAPLPSGSPAAAGTVTASPDASQTVSAPGTIIVPTLAPTAFPTPLGGVYTDVRIHIVVLQRAYLQVDVDGTTQFAGRVLPEETYDFIGRQTVSVSTGNGAGIRVIFNGVDEGPLGRFGALVSRTYTPTGVLEPTPRPSATPTVTPTPTRTTAP
jgi:cytoskeleton protein RodZ